MSVPRNTVYGREDIYSIALMDRNAQNIETGTKIAETDFEQALANAKTLAAASHAESTLNKYETGWGHFLSWCQSSVAHLDSISALPTNDQTLATYVGSQMHCPPGTVKGRLAAIRFIHKRAGMHTAFDNTPAFDAVYLGYRRHWAGTLRPQQSAATEDVIKHMADCWQGDFIAPRNRAILLLGFDAALRRSELVALDAEHLKQHAHGITIYLVKSKGDQLGEGATIEIPCRTNSSYCPVSALYTWLEVAQIKTGPIFKRLHRSGKRYHIGNTRLSDKSIYNIVKESAKKAGIEGNFGAHSLRRGFINSAIDLCDSVTEVQQHVRHKSLQSTTRYVQRTPNRAHPSERLLE